MSFGPVAQALKGHEAKFEAYLANRSRWDRFKDWLACEVIGGHCWMRLEDHPMHHICPICKRECMDWVW